MIPSGIDPSKVTRILFQDFSPWMLAIFYVYAIGCVAAFAWGVYVQIHKYRAGRRGARLAWGDIGRRLLDTAKTIASHRTLRRRDTAAGRLHAFI